MHHGKNLTHQQIVSNYQETKPKNLIKSFKTKKGHLLISDDGVSERIAKSHANYYDSFLAPFHDDHKKIMRAFSRIEAAQVIEKNKNSKKNKKKIK
jgi:hypothetical protein